MLTIIQSLLDWVGNRELQPAGRIPEVKEDRKMNITVEVNLKDGRHNESDSYTFPNPPIQMILDNAAQTVTDLFREGLDDDRNPEDFGIEAKTRAKENDKWSRQISGHIYQHGKVIGHFSGRSSYQFD